MRCSIPTPRSRRGRVSAAPRPRASIVSVTRSIGCWPSPDMRGGRRRSRRPPVVRCAASALPDDAHIRCLGALLPVGHVELDGLALLEVSVALTRDRGIVHEHVRTTVLEDEAEALLRAEPL